MSSRRIAPVIFAACISCAVGGVARVSAEDQPSIEPGAAKLLTAALEKLAGAKSFTFRAEVTNDALLPSGQKIQFAGMLTTGVRRPDGYWSIFDGEQRRTRSWYDGKAFTLLNVEKNVYATLPETQGLDALLATMRERVGFAPPLAMLLRENVAETALAKARTGFTVAGGAIGWTRCRHLAFRGEKVDWQVWIAETGEPLIKRIVITYKDDPGAPQYTVTFLEWDFQAKQDDALFSFAPPKDAVRSEFQVMER